MNQGRKLCFGSGTRNKSSPPVVVFYAVLAVTLESDVASMVEEAKSFELIWVRKRTWMAAAPPDQEAHAFQRILQAKTGVEEDGRR
jgi:hypothetical protein